MMHERTPHECCLLRWHRRDCSPCHGFSRQSNGLKVASRKLSIGSSVSADSVDRATAATPGGILNTSGIGSVAGATNGLAPTLDHVLDLKKEAAVDNADVASCGYFTNAKVESVLAKAKDSQSQYLLSPYGTELGRSQIAGRRFEVSNNVPSNVTKGSGTNLSAVIYGNFADLLIGLYGTLEMLVDPYTDFAKGTTGIRALLADRSRQCGEVIKLSSAQK